MRSDLIFRALTHVANRYQLSRLVAKATSKLHKPGARTQDTTNEVLMHVCGPSLVAKASAPSEPAFYLGATSHFTPCPGPSAMPHPHLAYLFVSPAALSPRRRGV
jgi:hypothetical protein